MKRKLILVDSWYVHLSGRHKALFFSFFFYGWKMGVIVVIDLAPFTARCLPFHCLFIKSKERRQPGDTCTKRQQRQAGHRAKSPSVCLWVSTSQAGTTWREIPGGQQSALNWPAVPHSICCPEAQQDAGPCQKEGERHRRATSHAATKPAFTRGSIQRRPTGSRRTGETICSNQGWSFGFIISNSPLSAVHLHSTPTTQKWNEIK